VLFIFTMKCESSISFSICDLGDHTTLAPLLKFDPSSNFKILLTIFRDGVDFSFPRKEDQNNNTNTPQCLCWAMESLFTHNLTNQMQTKEENNYGTRGTFPQYFKKNSVSRSTHLLGLQKFQYHLDCAEQKYNFLEPRPPLKDKTIGYLIQIIFARNEIEDIINKCTKISQIFNNITKIYQRCNHKHRYTVIHDFY
jgi:hypothetical protein